MAAPPVDGVRWSNDWNRKVERMKNLAVGILILAGIFVILGLAVETLGFLLGVAPILLIVAVLLLLLRRSRGRRIPR